MNAIHMFNPNQAPAFNNLSYNRISDKNEGANSFIQLLATTVSKATDKESSFIHNAEDQLDLLLRNLPEELVGELSVLFSELSLSDLEEMNGEQEENLDIEKLLNILSSESDLKEVIKEIFPLLSSKQISDLTMEEWVDNKNESESMLQNLLLNDVFAMNRDIGINETLEHRQQTSQLLTNIEKILTNITNEQEVKQNAPKLLELLEEWTKLEGKLSETTSSPVLEGEKAKEHRMWQDLLAFYKKRNGIVQSANPYKREAAVTTKDIANWLRNALGTNTSGEATVETQQQSLSVMRMSRIEQYVIYFNQTEQTQPVDKQLMDQFQHAIKSSRFLSMNNGINQLSFTLRPDNLGEMVVRLIEMQGEMTVKIIVSSQTTRKMLETNIHQLKHMFSPQQVVIEERELTTQDIKGNNDEQSFKEDKDEQSEQPNENKKENNDNTSFGKQFREVLLNEEV